MEICWCCFTGKDLCWTPKSPLWLFNRVASQCRSVGHKSCKKWGRKSKIKDILAFWFQTLGAVWTWSSKPVAQIPSSKTTRPDAERGGWKPLSPKPPNFRWQYRQKHLYLSTEAGGTACAPDVYVFKCLASLPKEFQRIGLFNPKWLISGSFLSLPFFAPS